MKAGAVDDSWAWVGGALVVVITGDILDRGDDDLEVMKTIDRVRKEASGSGGAVHLLVGNHEAANVDWKFIEVSAMGFADFNGEVSAAELSSPDLARLPPERRARAAAFRPGAKWALWLSQNPAVLVVGDTVFVHGGLRPDHVRHGIGRVNKKIRDWMLGRAKHRPAKLIGSEGPLWIRDYSKDTGKKECAQLDKVLKMLGATRMVVGHTIQPHINSACEGKVWRIDTGMNPEHFKGPIEVLEIKGDSVAPIR